MSLPLHSNSEGYLVRGFPSHKTKGDALYYAISLIGNNKRKSDCDTPSSYSNAIAQSVWNSNLIMSYKFPPLPLHIEQERNRKSLESYARHMSKGVIDPYKGATKLHNSGRIVGD